MNDELQLVKRLRGGGFGPSELQQLAVRLAHRIGFCIQPGTKNPAKGNCLFESAIFNINDRPELALFGQIKDTIQECRSLWVTQFQTQIPIYRPAYDVYTMEQWDGIKKDGAWEGDLGDLMPYCIAFATKKRILIIHTYDEAVVPLSIVEPEQFGQDRDCDMPICLAYNKSHYESVHPVGTETSIDLFEKTKLDDDCTFLTSTDVKSMLALGPLTPAEKKKRSRQINSLGAEPSPRKVMTPDEKRQKKTAEKQLQRDQNPEQYGAEKERIAEQQALNRLQNPEKYRAEKERIAEQQRKKKNLPALIENDTSFESICCCCVEFKSADKTRNIADCLTLGEIRKYCYRTKMTMELDNTFSVCGGCKTSIKAKKIPSKAQRDLFQLSSFPDTFLQNVMSKLNNPHPTLNKVEQFLLKLVIPFIRVAHCERGPQMKVRGNLILISADIASSLEKILPQSQNTIPVRLKSQLVYTGHY